MDFYSKSRISYILLHDSAAVTGPLLNDGTGSKMPKYEFIIKEKHDVRPEIKIET